MYGTILGDIIGSPYAFDHSKKSKDFKLFNSYSEYTGDTILAVATGEALLDAGKEASEKQIYDYVTKSLRKWGNNYLDVEYDMRFRFWLSSKEPQPYNSYGNDVAVRAAAAGWLYDSVERTREAARISVAVTHSHIEGSKGAEAVASAVFLARKKHSKSAIKQYMESEFQYDLSRTCDEIRPMYSYQEACQKTVPEAVTAFLEGKDFEDVLRIAISLGGDCNTVGAIAGSIAEAYYEIPSELKDKCENYLPADVKAVLLRFDKIIQKCR